jgi:DNA-binding transcriptional ArsR family regulator
MQTPASLPQLCLFDPEIVRAQVKDTDKETTTLALAASIMNVLALEDPRNARFLRRVELAIRRQAARTQTGDRARVLSAIRDGLATAAEIADKTAIPWVTVQLHLRKLHDQGLIVRTASRSDEKGSGGDRRTFLYWPVE